MKKINKISIEEINKLIREDKRRHKEYEKEIFDLCKKSRKINNFKK